MVGLVAAYTLVRLRASRRLSCGPRPSAGWSYATLRLTLGSVIAAGLWIAVDLLLDEDFLGALWTALPPRHENVVKALVLVACGWAGWAIALSEAIHWLVTSMRLPKLG